MPTKKYSWLTRYTPGGIPSLETVRNSGLETSSQECIMLGSVIEPMPETCQVKIAYATNPNNERYYVVVGAKENIEPIICWMWTQTEGTVPETRKFTENNFTKWNIYAFTVGTLYFATANDHNPNIPIYTGYGSLSDNVNAAVEAMADDDWSGIEDNNPYNPGGSTGAGGGNGDFDGTSDPIEIPNLPTISSVDTGFISLFNPTNFDLKNLANYMWGDLFDISTWKKIFADPMDAILGLSIVPVSVPDGGNSELTVGNIPTGIMMKRAASQYVSVDCGSLNVNEFWGAYLDYEPFTKAELYLPYIGTHPIAVDDIMGKTVQVVYHVDILSGACCAYVKCGSSVLYSFVGQCSSSIPITGNDWTNVINGALSIATAIGSMVATGGASAPLAIGTVASTAVNQMKPSIEKSGSMGGTGGLLGIQSPYLILTRPRQAIPSKQNVFMGYPSFISEKLSSLTGYTEIESIHLENIPATEQELSELESLLKSGVIL